MRDVMFGAGGFVVGGLVGVAGLVGIEALVAGAVALTWVAMTPPAPAEIVDGAPVATTTVRGSAPRATSSAPGQVQIHTIALARVMLDGNPMAFDAPSGSYLASVPPGEHRVQVLDALGTSVRAEAVVSVSSGVRSQLRYAKGQLTNQGTMPATDLGAVSSVSVAPQGYAVSAAAPVQTLTVSSGVQGVSISSGAQGISVSAGAPALTLSEEPAAVAVGAEPGRATIRTGVGTIDVKLPKFLGAGR